MDLIAILDLIIQGKFTLTVALVLTIVYFAKKNQKLETQIAKLEKLFLEESVKVAKLEAKQDLGTIVQNYEKKIDKILTLIESNK
jgi:hypothetical protein